MEELKQDTNAEINSLEGSSTVIEPTISSGGSVQGAPAEPSGAAAGGSTPSPKVNRIRGFLDRFNIYLLVFLLLIILAAVATTIFYLQATSKRTDNNGVSSQQLSQSELEQLSNSDVNVGEPKHTLTVQSNAVFAGNVLLRSNLQIAGTLQVGSQVAINGMRVTGNSTLDDVQITKSLALTGNGSIQGQLNVQKNLSVSGSGTFLGAVSAPSITVGSIQISGDLNLTHHIAAGGGTPSRSNGTALGSGGTVSVSGSDTAGSVTINTGSSPGPGCFLTINFAAKFNSTPRIVVTPVGSGAAELGYYVNRSTTNFSICTTTTPPAGTTFGFDYLAFD